MTSPEASVFTYREHNVARAKASGMENRQAAVAAEVSTQRVSALCRNANFQTLIEYYRGEIDTRFHGLHEKMLGITSDILDEIRNRFETDAGEIPTKELIKIFETLADRSGYSRQAAQTAAVSVNIGTNIADGLQQAIEREHTAAIEHTTAIEHQPAVEPETSYAPSKLDTQDTSDDPDITDLEIFS